MLDRSGFVGWPHWDNVRAGFRPPPKTVAEPGEWQHGWQFCASSALEFHFRETVVLPQSSAAHQAHLRSHSGQGPAQCCVALPQALSSSCNRQSFGLQFLSDCGAPTPSQRHLANAERSWTAGDAIAPRIPRQADCVLGRLLRRGLLHASVGRQGQWCVRTSNCAT